MNMDALPGDGWKRKEDDAAKGCGARLITPTAAKKAHFPNENNPKRTEELA
jgi:hypothetical protein